MNSAMIRVYLGIVLWAIDVHVALKRRYEESYGNPSKRPRRWPREGKHQIWSYHEPPAPQRQPFEYGKLERAARDARSSPAPPPPPDKDTFLEYSKLFDALRRVSHVYMVYIVIRFVLIEYFSESLRRKLNLDKPLHCYLVGKLLVHDSFAGTMALVSALSQINWRFYVHILNRPYNFSALHFILLSESELKTFYANIFRSQQMNLNQCIHECSAQPSFIMDAREANSLTPREHFILDTMCYRSFLPGQVVYTLRLNRTAAIHSRVRQHFVTMVVIAFTAAMLLLSNAFVYSYGLLTIDERYLRVYPNCDPHLKWLNETGQLPPGSVTLTKHHLFTILIDLYENVLLWVEGTCIFVFGPIAFFGLNSDLVQYWGGIDEKLRKMLKRIKQQTATPPTRFESHTRGESREEVARKFSFDLEKLNQLNKARQVSRVEICALQAEVMDFFREVDQVDVIISDNLNILAMGVLAFISMIFVTSHIKFVGIIPIEIIILTSTYLLCASVSLLSLLTLQRHCNRSYTTICSIMAHDRSGLWQGFMTILDMYKSHKTCYTFYRSYAFKTTTLLKLVGYSFSCFFLIYSLFREPC